MLQEFIVVPPQPSWSILSRRHPVRWAGRAGGALLVSAAAHAMLALTVGVVVRSMASKGSAAVPDVVDVDVGPAIDWPARDPQPTTGAVHEPSKVPTLRRSVPVRRMKATIAHDTSNVSGPSIVSAPAEADEPARFALSAGVVATRPGAASGHALASHENGPEGIASAEAERDVNVPARLVSSSPLVYPPAARKAEIEIDFPLEIVVDAEGRVAAAHAVSRVGYGLDEAALNAIREYRFSPAQRGGRPVRVRMRWIVQFRLR